MQVSVTTAKNKLTQLIAAVEKGERVTIVRHGHPVVDLVPTRTARPAPKFGTLRDKFAKVTSEQWRELTRPMTDEESAAFVDGRY
jgi:prevent-host-death family protein